MTFTYEQQQEIRARVAEKAQVRFQRYVDIAHRYLAHLIERKLVEEELPAVRFAHYVMYPPVLPDGMPTPPGETGEWDYPGLAAEMPWLYERFVKDWGELTGEGLKNAANEVADEQEGEQG